MKKIYTLIAFLAMCAMLFEAKGQDLFPGNATYGYDDFDNAVMNSTRPNFSKNTDNGIKKSRNSSGMFDLASPDGKVQLLFNDILKRKKRSWEYSQYRMEVTIKYIYDDPESGQIRVNTIVEDARFEFTVKDGFKRTEFGKGNIVDIKNIKVSASSSKNTDERLKQFTGDFNAYIIEMENGISLEVRAYNMGVAYRYIVRNQPAEYKVIDVGPIFPHELPIAILGTFRGDYIMPWRTMIVDPEVCNAKMFTTDEFPDDFIVNAVSYVHTYGMVNKQKGLKLINRNEYTQTDFHKAKIVPWRDALSFGFIGTSFDSFCGGTRWGDVLNGFFSLNLNYIYRYLYFGLGITPCHEFLYIYFDEHYPPFDHVAGPIHERNFTGRVGFNLPVQSGFGLWNISSYLSTSTMKFTQHDYYHPLFDPLQISTRNLIGGGVNVSYAFQEGWALSLGYEFRAFTHPESPIGIHSFHVGVGYKF